MMQISRRMLIAGAAACVVAGCSHARAKDTPRIAAIDWAMLETALALDVQLIAGTELLQFRDVAVEPSVPVSVADLGLRGVPNYELLRMCEPDLILSSMFYERQRPRLEPIAPILSLSVYLPGQLPYALAEQATQALGERLDRSDSAQALIARTAAAIAAQREHVARIKRPVFIVSLGDARHVRVFGSDSMFGDVLSRLGLVNAWPTQTSYSATAPVGMEVLALVPDAAIVVIGPTPPDVVRSLKRNALWQALPAVKNKRLFMLDPINHFGALPAANRFVRLVSTALRDAGEATNG